jgi:prepilin peptidase CpaA
MGVVLLAVAISAVTDVRTFKVHNTLTLPLLVGGLAYYGVSGTPGDLLSSILGAWFGFLVLLLFYLLGGMGAGDVKLMAGIGAWLGLKLTLYVFLSSSLIAGIYVLATTLPRRRAGKVFTDLRSVWHRLTRPGQPLMVNECVEVLAARPEARGRLVPFAPMIALGVLATFLWVYFRGETP